MGARHWPAGPRLDSFGCCSPASLALERARPTPSSPRWQYDFDAPAGPPFSPFGHRAQTATKTLCISGFVPYRATPAKVDKSRRLGVRRPPASRLPSPATGGVRRLLASGFFGSALARRRRDLGLSSGTYGLRQVKDVQKRPPPACEPITG